MARSRRVTVPFSTFETKTLALSNWSSIVKSHGPSSLVIKGEGDITLPFRSRNSSGPALIVANLPSVDAADEHEAALEHTEGGGQAGEGPFEEFGCLASRRHRAAGCKFDDRRAGSLKVVTIVEVRN